MICTFDGFYRDGRILEKKPFRPPWCNQVNLRENCTLVFFDKQKYLMIIHSEVELPLKQYAEYTFCKSMY